MWSHGIATILAVGSLILMIAAADGEILAVVSAAIFGTTLVLLYLASTIYHAHTCPRLKPMLQLLDHACIYLLIAGSYTPLTLVALGGKLGWWLFGIIWGLAICGVTLKSLIKTERETWWSTGLYLLMGWLAVTAIRPLLDAISVAGFLWLILGGLSYSLGIIFFVWKSLRFNHAIWHIFVMVGSACHVVATTLYILN